MKRKWNLLQKLAVSFLIFKIPVTIAYGFSYGDNIETWNEAACALIDAGFRIASLILIVSLLVNCIDYVIEQKDKDNSEKTP